MKYLLFKHEHPFIKFVGPYKMRYVYSTFNPFMNMRDTDGFRCLWIKHGINMKLS
jgi:hypothetical protein